MKFDGSDVTWPDPDDTVENGEISPEDCGSVGVGPGACGLYAAIGEVSLRAALEAAKTMQERGTFGAGVLLRGVYPKRKEQYAFHVMYRNRKTAKELEPLFTEGKLGMRHFGEMEALMTPEAYRRYDLPEMRRYFLNPPTKDEMLRHKHTSVEERYVRALVEEFNIRYMGKARIFSSGKNIGTFLTALQLEQTIESFDLYQYEEKPLSAIMIHMRWCVCTPRSARSACAPRSKRPRRCRSAAHSAPECYCAVSTRSEKSSTPSTSCIATGKRPRNWSRCLRKANWA